MWSPGRVATQGYPYLSYNLEDRVTALTLGFVGFGEVGVTFSKGLRQQNPDLGLSAFDVVWDERRRAAADEYRVRIAASVEELVRQSDVVICAVVGKAAIDAARSAAPFLSAQHLYADLTSIGPAKVREIDKIVAARGAQFAKLSLMGAVAAFGYRVPSVASGRGARALAQCLTSLGMDVDALNDDPAAAATMKLCRSLFQKGIVALAIETLRVARKNGIERQVVASLAETWDEEKFENALMRLVCSSAVHASRRAAELDEALDSFGELGMALPVARACRETFGALVDLQQRDSFGGQSPKDLGAVLDALERV